MSACGDNSSSLSSDYLPEVERSKESLFPTDAAALPDSTIARILRYKVALPPTVRIALLQLGGRRSSYMGGNAATNLLADSAVLELGKQPRVGVVNVLPDLLLPEKYTVTTLREAAARYQADVLVVYRPDCDTYSRMAVIRDDASRAICRIDALLLDVRSGVIPMSYAATVESELTEKKAATRSELILAAETSALTKAMTRVNTALGAYLAPLDTLR